MISVITLTTRHSTFLPMVTEITYQHQTTSLNFSECKSLERYLLHWITKPIHLTIRFEHLTEQMNYYSEITDVIRSFVKAQRSQGSLEWMISVYGFDQQTHSIDVAA